MSIIFISGIAGFCIIISLYIQKTWDKAHNFLSNLLPHLDDPDEPSDGVVDISSEKVTSVASNVGETLNKMFMKLNDEIVDAKCDFGNIVSAKGNWRSKTSFVLDGYKKAFSK